MKRNAWKATCGSAGFTLVELVVVIAILGILAGVGTVGYSGYVQRANEAVDDTLYHDIIYAGAIGSYADPGASGRVTVTKEKATVSSTSGDEAVVEQWMENAFGSDWENTVKYKTDTYAENANYCAIALPQVEITLTEEEKELVDNFKDSNYSGHEGELMDTVDGLADALAGNVDNLGAIAALDEEMYKDYMQAMVEAGYATQNPDGTYTVDPDKADEFANASVLYIASQYQGEGYDAAAAQQAVYEALTGPEEEMMDKLAAAGNGNTLAGAIMAYALTFGYANSDSIDPARAEEIKSAAAGVGGVGTMLEYFKTVNNDDYRDYLNSDEGKQDVDGYLSVMEMLNKYGDRIDITIDNAYGSDSALGLLQGILNGK